MKPREFIIQRLRPDGEADGEPRRLSWPDAFNAIALEWPKCAPLANLKHSFALARAGTGHPVDAIAFDGERIAYSARIHHVEVSHGTQA